MRFFLSSVNNQGFFNPSANSAYSSGYDSPEPTSPRSESLKIQPKSKDFKDENHWKASLEDIDKLIETVDEYSAWIEKRKECKSSTDGKRDPTSFYSRYLLEKEYFRNLSEINPAERCWNGILKVDCCALLPRDRHIEPLRLSSTSLSIIHPSELQADDTQIDKKTLEEIDALIDRAGSSGIQNAAVSKKSKRISAELFSDTMGNKKKKPDIELDLTVPALNTRSWDKKRKYGD